MTDPAIRTASGGASEGMGLCKVERLAIAAAFAPLLRAEPEAGRLFREAARDLGCSTQVLEEELRTLVDEDATAPEVREHAAALLRDWDARAVAKARRIGVTDASGKTVRYVTLGDVQEGLLARAKIELAVDRKRERLLLRLCKVCGRFFRLPARRGGTSQTVCPRELGGCHRQESCAAEGCVARPSRQAFDAASVRSRKGAPWRCKGCSAKENMRKANAANAALTPEQRSEAASKANAARTPEQLRENGRKAWAARTPEQRREISRKARAALTPEQLRENGRKANAARTSEHRSEATRKAWAARTSEHRSEASRKAWETRRARANQAEA